MTGFLSGVKLFVRSIIITLLSFLFEVTYLDWLQINCIICPSLFISEFVSVFVSNLILKYFFLLFYLPFLLSMDG